MAEINISETKKAGLQQMSPAMLYSCKFIEIGRHTVVSEEKFDDH